MNPKDLELIEIFVKYPILKGFCIKNNINWKIDNIEYFNDDRFVTFNFYKVKYGSLVRRYIINNEAAFIRVINMLMDDLCQMGFGSYDDEPKKANNMKIKNVIFQNPATIVFWEDGTKTVVRAEGEDYDPEKGLAMAISRKALGNNRDYYNTFIHWLKKYKKEEIILDSDYDVFPI